MVTPRVGRLSTDGQAVESRLARGSSRFPSRPGPGHKVYLYLPGGMAITRPNQVWAADITYVPMTKGFLYLVAIMDWYTRYVVAWSLSNTLDADFCVQGTERRKARGLQY